jgi:hypothetical protein
LDTVTSTSDDQIHSRTPPWPDYSGNLGRSDGVLYPICVSLPGTKWPCEDFIRCWPWLLASLEEFFQTHTKDQVWERIANGRAYFWPGRNCAIVGQLVKHPIGIRSFNYWLQGGDLDELLSMHPGIEEWARERGCKVATGIGREGWARMMEGNWQKGPSTRIKWLSTP